MRCPYSVCFNPSHISGSRILQSTRTWHGQSCTCVLSQAPKDHLGLDQLAESRLTTEPALCFFFMQSVPQKPNCNYGAKRDVVLTQSKASLEN